jgi:hypothetical protein
MRDNVGKAFGSLLHAEVPAVLQDPQKVLGRFVVKAKVVGKSHRLTRQNPIMRAKIKPYKCLVTAHFCRVRWPAGKRLLSPSDLGLRDSR